MNNRYRLISLLIAFALPVLSHAQGDAQYDDSRYGDAQYDDARDNGGWAVENEAASSYSGEDVADVPGYDGSYSYLRTLEGSATLIPKEEEERSQAEINQPVLRGDRLWTSPRSRAEVLLSDGNLVRLDGDTEAVFDRLAYSPDTDDRMTELTLRFGNVQWVVVDGSIGDHLPRMFTPNAEILLNDFGTYRVTTEGGDWTSIVVRQGEAEIVTDRGRVLVRAGEEALVEGSARPDARIRTASTRDSLEHWGEDLDRAADGSEYVDDSLRYAAAPLNDHGDWVEADGQRAWRPRVADDWRPYWQGRWQSTRLGMTWVSSESWGWVPYHYGSWSRHHSYGWVWYPGHRFAPAWVYWHFGDRHTAWVPVGYYTRHYRRHRAFRHGVYGWAGGDWGYYRDWIFCTNSYFGSRYQRRHHYDGYGYRRHTGHRNLPRGIVTTDTRYLHRKRLREPGEAIRVLQDGPRRRGNGRGVNVNAQLPDITPFVARRDALPDDVKKRIIVDQRGERRLAGTPLAPGTANNPGIADIRRPRSARPGVPRSDTKANSPRSISVGVADRPTGARQIKPRVGDPRVGDQGADRPRAVKPRVASPQAGTGTDGPTVQRPGTVKPRPATPRAGTLDRPRAAKPRAEQPRADAPRATKPRAATPRSGTVDRPQAAKPRAAAPRTGNIQRPRTVKPRPAPRTQQPSAVKPRASAPRAAPRTNTPRTQKPRTQQPRADAPRRVKPRAATPPAERPKVTPRSTSPRRQPARPRASAPTKPAPTYRAPAPRKPQARRAPQASAPIKRSAPRASAPVKRSAPRASAPIKRSAPRASAPVKRSAPRASAPVKRSAPRASAPAKRPAPRASAPKRSGGSKARASSGSTQKKAPARSNTKRRPRNKPNQ